MSRLALLADLHADDLGSATNPETGLNVRFEDALGIARWVAQDASRRHCDALVVLGDLTERRHPAPWRVAMIARALDEFDGPIILLRGNHDGQRADFWVGDVITAADPLRERWRAINRPEVVELYGRDLTPTSRQATPTVAIGAIPYLDRSWLRASAPELASAPDADVYRRLEGLFLELAGGLYATARKGGAPTILAIHQSLAGGQMSEQQAAFLGGVSLVVDEAALASIGYDAIVAGHFHLHQVLREDPLVLYVGSPARVTFQEERQRKGYVVLDTDRLPGFEFVETPARRFVTMRYVRRMESDPDPEPDEPTLAGYGFEMEGDVITSPDDLQGAIVRVLDVPAGADLAYIRRTLDGLGAAEVSEIRLRPAEPSTPSRGLGEALAPTDALAAWLEGDPGADALLELGRQILEEAAA